MALIMIFSNTLIKVCTDELLEVALINQHQLIRIY